MTVDEVAAYLKLKPSKIRSMVFRGEIPFLKLGRLVRFERQLVDTWLAQQVVPYSTLMLDHGKSKGTFFEIVDTRFNKANPERK